MYATQQTLTRTLRVAYPSGRGKIVLRTELDWEKNVEPVEVSPDGTISTFQIQSKKPFLYFKACLLESGRTHWAVGPNGLLLMTEADRRLSYPFFFSSAEGRFSRLVEAESKILGRTHRIRGYLPPGYDENTLAHYPTIYMQDGQNAFFPEEAFMGQTWEVGESNQILRDMGALEDCMILAIHSGDRMHEYTKPGYEAYARSLVEEIVPELDRRGVRTLQHRRFRSVWGSSLRSAGWSRSTAAGSIQRFSARPLAFPAPFPTRTT